MKIVLLKDGDVLKPETGKLPSGLPDRFTIEINEITGSNADSESKRTVRRRTKNGRIIHEAEDFVNRECPIPYDPDL